MIINIVITSALFLPDAIIKVCSVFIITSSSYFLWFIAHKTFTMKKGERKRLCHDGN